MKKKRKKTQKIKERLGYKTQGCFKRRIEKFTSGVKKKRKEITTKLKLQ